MPAILPAAPMRFRSRDFRSTMRAYWPAWTAVGVEFERVPRYDRPPTASRSPVRSSASETVTMSIGSRRSDRSSITA